MELKKDKYKSKRSGASKIIDIFCSKCSTFIMTYQKDGSGALYRTYLDRIIAPDTLRDLAYSTEAFQEVLACPKCDQAIGMSYVYEKENRPAFRLIYSNYFKRLHKGK